MTTIQYRVNLLSGGPECFSGAALAIGIDAGVPCLMLPANCQNIASIEVYVPDSAGTREFKIVGQELTPVDSYADEGRLEESSSNPSDPGRFLGWKRETIGTTRTLTLSFRAPESHNSTYSWTLFKPDAPPPAIKVKVKRQEFVNSGACASWPAIS